MKNRLQSKNVKTEIYITPRYKKNVLTTKNHEFELLIPISKTIVVSIRVDYSDTSAVAKLITR